MKGAQASPKVVLIGGIGRTGTNALKDFLGAHPRAYAMPFESRITVDPDGLLQTLALLDSCWSPFVANKALNRLNWLLARAGRRSLLDRLAIWLERLLAFEGGQLNFRTYKEWELEKYFPGYRVARTRLISDLTAYHFKGVWPGAVGLGKRKIRGVTFPNTEIATASVKRFLETTYQSALEANEADCFIDDNTYNIFFAPELLTILPRGHLVHLVRDPRDIAASLSQQRWAPRELAHCADLVDASLFRGAKASKTLDIDRFTEVRLEDLLGKSSSEMKRLCARLEIDLHPASPTLLSTERANVGRWKALSAAERAFLSDRLSHWVEVYGYER